jgi:hypothetical protein
MQPTPQQLAETYAGRSDEEMRSLHATGTLTETAYEILERELRSRDVAKNGWGSHRDRSMATLGSPETRRSGPSTSLGRAASSLQP